MKTRILVSLVLLPIFFAILFVFPPYVLTFVISIICAIAAFELLYATGCEKNKRILAYTMIAAALIPLAVYLSFLPVYSLDEAMSAQSADIVSDLDLYSRLVLISLLFTVVFIFMSMLLIEVILSYKTKKHIKFRLIPIALAAGILIPYMLSSLVSLKSMYYFTGVFLDITPYGHLLVLLPIVSAFLTDSGAYFIGVAIGKRKAFPNISPNKTVEGCVGGIISGTAGIMIYGMIIANTTNLTVIFPALVIYGIIGAVITEFGDLVFSFIKRKCGIKDYGKLIPGHGGMLDRFDSMIFTAPTMYLLVILLPAIIA
ncbi:MAG: phosphatidate cytidylyltransferase [Oscillospiraceae bacterium]|jgi:phosphatidate cytidylyltransferase|nr:phosphatidate cytidylyltransferase [Oscillospiraceae bacterium]